MSVETIREKLTNAKVSPEIIELLIQDGFNTEDSFAEATKDDLKEAGVLLVSDRNKIKRVYPLPVQSAGQTVEVNLQAEATATQTVAQASPYGAYAHLLQDDDGVLGIAATALGAQINPTAIRRAAAAASASVIAGTGVLTVFNGKFCGEQ
jgi:hypothetical protein